MEIDVEGRRIYAYTGGRALAAVRPAIVFVHGAGNDHSVWALQSRYFAHHGRNVLAIDLPAHGRSGGEPIAGVEDLATFLGALLEGLGTGRHTLVGHSMGALAALQCAASYPERVGKLALLGPAAPMPVSEELLDAARRNDHIACELINGWSFSVAAQLGGNTIPGMWMIGSAMRLLERSRPGVLAVDLAACNAYANGVAAAARVRAPALVILGARDIMAPPRNAKALVDALSDKRVISLPDTGHALMAERPDAVLDALRGFL
ncbi:MAG TPA: alpha/beta hydrolase [Casimicrobiaceae bacterium]|nr:alpha/beta hydrolase [Casimicrobiaceae bacterium]